MRSDPMSFWRACGLFLLCVCLSIGALAEEKRINVAKKAFIDDGALRYRMESVIDREDTEYFKIRFEVSNRSETENFDRNKWYGAFRDWKLTDDRGREYKANSTSASAGDHLVPG